MTASDALVVLPLFDPRTQQPPADAIEIQFTAPPEATNLYRFAVVQGWDDLAWLLRDAQHTIAGAALKRVQLDGGYAKRGRHVQRPGRRSVGEYVEAHLRAVVLSHQVLMDVTDPRRAVLHDHLYVSTTAVAPDDRQQYPVDVDGLPRAIQLAAVDHSTMWRAHIHGLVSEDPEIPPMNGPVELPLCRGPWAMRDVRTGANPTGRRVA